jgi:hypothetical protein
MTRGFGIPNTEAPTMTEEGIVLTSEVTFVPPWKETTEPLFTSTVPDIEGLPVIFTVPDMLGFPTIVTAPDIEGVPAMFTVPLIDAPCKPDTTANTEPDIFPYTEFTVTSPEIEAATAPVIGNGHVGETSVIIEVETFGLNITARPVTVVATVELV